MDVQPKVTLLDRCGTKLGSVPESFAEELVEHGFRLFSDNGKSFVISADSNLFHSE